MTRLRQAGSPVTEPEKLSRAKQDGILLECVVSARIQARRMRWRPDTTVSEDIAGVRAALRVDDPVLDDLIVRGAHRGPWRSPTDKERAAS